jgi:hypothetical protein
VDPHPDRTTFIDARKKLKIASLHSKLALYFTDGPVKCNACDYFMVPVSDYSQMHNVTVNDHQFHQAEYSKPDNCMRADVAPLPSRFHSMFNLLGLKVPPRFRFQPHREAWNDCPTGSKVQQSYTVNYQGTVTRSFFNCCCGPSVCLDQIEQILHDMVEIIVDPFQDNAHLVEFLGTLTFPDSHFLSQPNVKPQTPKKIESY